jgi:hypothetical protein
MYPQPACLKLSAEHDKQSIGPGSNRAPVGNVLLTSSCPSANIIYALLPVMGFLRLLMQALRDEHAPAQGPSDASTSASGGRNSPAPGTVMDGPVIDVTEEVPAGSEVTANLHCGRRTE